MTQQEKMIIGAIGVLVLLMLGLFWLTRGREDATTVPMGSTSVPSVLGTSTTPVLNGTSTTPGGDFEQKG